MFPVNFNHDKKLSVKWVPGTKNKSVVLCTNALYLSKWCKWDLNRQMFCLNGLITIWSPLSSVCQPWSCQLSAITAVIISIRYTLTTHMGEAPGTLSFYLWRARCFTTRLETEIGYWNYCIILKFDKNYTINEHSDKKNCNIWQFCL